MGKGFLEVIKQVGIFIIFAQMLLHFKPAESYGKYLRLLVSLMVLVQALVPVLGLIFHGMPGKFDERRHFFNDSFERQLKEINITCVMAEELLNNLTMEEIKLRINNLKFAEEREEKAENGTKENRAEENEGKENGLQQAAGKTETGQEGRQETTRIQIDRVEVKTDD